MAEETQALIRFKEGWAADGTGDDGLPRYKPTVRIVKSVPPLTQVEYEATQQDFDDYPGPYQLFVKEQGARLQQPGEAGFPLALWPVVSASQFKMLADRDINTVEQLAKYAGRRDTAMPGDLVELADRARAMIAMSANVGKFEAEVRDRDAQIEVLKEQVKELQATVSAQNSMINSLKQRVA
jgi:hypothetical protein